MVARDHERPDQEPGSSQTPFRAPCGHPLLPGDTWERMEPGTKSQEWDVVARSPHRSGLARVAWGPERKAASVPFPQ